MDLYILEQVFGVIKKSKKHILKEFENYWTEGILAFD